MLQSAIVSSLILFSVEVEYPPTEVVEEPISPLVVTDIGSFGELQLANGIEALDAGDSALALRLLSDYLERYPDSELAPNARYIASRAALEEKVPNLALQWLANLEEEMPEVEDFVLAARATAHRHLAQWKDSLSQWDLLLTKYAKSPLRVEALYGAADAHFALNNSKMAKRAYERAMKASARSDRADLARFNLAQMAEDENKLNDAAELYRYFYYELPSDPLSDVAKKRLDLLESSSGVLPPSVPLRFKRLKKLITRRSIERARLDVDALDKLKLSRSDRAELKFLESQLLYRERRYADAESLLQELQKSSSRSRRNEIQRWLARVYSTSGQTRKAIDIYLTLAKNNRRNSTGSSSLYRAAWLAFNGGLHSEAVKLFGEFISRYPRSNSVTSAQWYLAWNAYRLGDIPSAIATVDRMLRRYPNTSLKQQVTYWRGRWLTMLNRSKEAIETLRRAYSIQPLHYYGVLSRQRLFELNVTPNPLTSIHPNRPLLASNDDSDALAAEEFIPEADELPELGRVPTLPPEPVPWGGSLFEWNTDNAKRALRLIKLGHGEFASSLVRELKAIPGYTDAEVTYARSLLQQSLGAYNLAFQLIVRQFGDTLKRQISSDNLSVFRVAYPAAFESLVRRKCDNVGMDPSLIWAIMRQESAFAIRALSWASAQGLMQIIPITGRKIAEALNKEDYDVSMLRTPETSIEFGSWYFSELIKKFHGHPALAIASYNAGPLAVSRWVDARPGIATDEFIEEIPYKETRHYVKKVLSNYSVYRELNSPDSLVLPQQIATNYLDNINF